MKDYHHAKPVLTLRLSVINGNAEKTLHFTGHNAYKNLLGIKTLHFKGVRGTKNSQVKLNCRLYFDYGAKHQLALYEQVVQCALQRGERLWFPDDFVKALRDLCVQRFTMSPHPLAVNPMELTVQKCREAWHNPKRKLNLSFLEAA